MTDNTDFNKYIDSAIRTIISDVLKSTLQNPKETAFLIRYRAQNTKNQKKREKLESNGTHVPAFLISSIADSCNLFCKGCYARENGICSEGCGGAKPPVLSAEEWEKLFLEAAELGISFNLLAGGEPLLRRDVIEKAAAVGETIFPIFTNGTLFDQDYLKLFDRHRNLIPVVSLEGGEKETDERRGEGTYQRLLDGVEVLKEKKILFGVSLTVTTENLDRITSKEFLEELRYLGCRVVFYVEYVPVQSGTEQLAPGEKERQRLEEVLISLRAQNDSMLFLSFPGDESEMGGCLAAGRGFFHINPYGEAEACPFSPYSDRSVKEQGLLYALQSPLFRHLREENLVGGEHIGGCTLFQNEEKVKSLL